MQETEEKPLSTKSLGTTGARASPQDPPEDDERPEDEEFTQEELRDDSTPLPFTGLTTSVLPSYTLKAPFEIPLPLKTQPFIYAINAPLIGLPQHPDPVAKPLRNALWIARAFEYPIIILTGNIIHLDTTQAGKHQGFRALASDTEDAEESQEMFQDIEDRLAARLAKLRNQVCDREGNPIIQGTLYATFGRSEDEIINGWVSKRVRETVAREKRGIVEMTRNLEKLQKKDEKERAAAERDLEDLREKEGEGGYLPHEQEQLWTKITLLTQEIARRKGEILSLDVKEKKINATNLSEALRKQWFLEAQRRLIDLYEREVPGLKVISTGNCVVRIGGKTVEIKQNPRQTIADTFADQVQNDTRSGLKNGQSMPDLILIAGYNVAGTTFQVNYPKSMEDPHQSTTTYIGQLPMCVDISLLKQIADASVRVGPFLTRLIGTEYFAAGVRAHGWRCGIPSHDSWYIRDLAPKPPDRPDKTPSLAYHLLSEPARLFDYAKSSFMIWRETDTDMQEGSKHQSFYDIPDHKILGLITRVTIYQFHHAFFLKHRFPISGYLNGGDVVQGENHPQYHLEVPSKYLPPYQMRAGVRAILVSSITPQEKANRIGELALRNTWLNGVQRVDQQMEQYITQAYVEGSEYFSHVLRQAKRIGIQYMGEAAPITLLGGNHFGNTPFVGKHFNEAVMCQDRLRQILVDRHNFSREEVAKLILAPFGSALTVSRAQGAFGIKGFFPYCLSAKHKPGRGGARSKNPIKSMRAVRVRIGTTAPIFKDRFIIEEAGHIDRNADCMTPNGVISLAPAQEFQGPYAEDEDFPLADVGTIVMGLPAPAIVRQTEEVFGPVIRISFSYETMYEYIKNPWKIETKTIFPNSL